MCRGMLSSAHVLAMDAKNLLDVVDCIRLQYPRVDHLITRWGKFLIKLGKLKSGFAIYKYDNITGFIVSVNLTHVQYKIIMFFLLFVHRYESYYQNPPENR